MPHSGGPYSADGGDNTDARSLNDQLSPVDGFFSHRDMPRDIVSDSSAEENTADTKQIFNITPIETIHSTTSSINPFSRSSVSHTPLGPAEDFSNGNPPPAYSPSSSSTASLPVQTRARSFDIFSGQHCVQGFLSNRESMGGHVGEADERLPLLRSHRSSLRRVIIQKVLLVAFIFATAVGLLINLFCIAKSDSVKSPEIDPWPNGDREFYCPSTISKDKGSVCEIPSGADLSVLQTIRSTEWSRKSVEVTTFGEILFRRTPKDSMHGGMPYFTINSNSSDPDLQILPTWNQISRVFEVSVPKYAFLPSPGPHSISLEITAWLPEGAEFSNISLHTTSLSCRVLDDTVLKVTGTTTFITVAGNIRLDSQPPDPEEPYPFDSRRIIVKSESGSIKGTYPLMDYLSLTSHGGSIKVDVVPRPILASRPLPAEFEAFTSAGAVDVYYPIDAGYLIPPRDYITRVQATAGSIKGNYFLGSVSSFKSTAGSIKITGLPALQDEKNDSSQEAQRNTFSTSNSAGTTRVEVRDPVIFAPLSSASGTYPGTAVPVENNNPYGFITSPSSNLQAQSAANKKAALRTLHSTHTGSAGSVHVQYPETFEGNIEAKSTAGSVEVTGRGIEIIGEHGGWGGKTVLARKGTVGNEGSFVDLYSSAGSVRFYIGYGRFWED